MAPCNNTGIATVRAKLAEVIPKTAFPPLPTLKRDDEWRTHTSYRAAVHYPFEAPEDEEMADYERLEHVGDAILGAEVSIMIHERFPRLVLVKASLIANTTLALISEALGLPPRLLSAAAQAKQFKSNTYIRACMFESFLATLQEEQGPVALRKFLRGIYDPILGIAVETYRPFHSHSKQVASDPSISYVNKMMEWKTEKGHAGDRTLDWVKRASGRPDQATWIVECMFKDEADPKSCEPRTTSGSHSSVRGAKNAAAANACLLLGIV
ncbi:ribonuclease III domain-containing protein [Sporobolomyces salmoneus]|uniref:ribonuclease III domain-containing protein n=1 Tax=Sporobolomyces salmoneus TaxID=183962 RepID=UPI003178FD56